MTHNPSELTPSSFPLPCGERIKVRGKSKGDEIMSKYILLITMTEQGTKNIAKQDAPQQIEETTKILEAAGCKMIDHYILMGEYDFMAIFEAESDEVMMTQLLRMNAGGNFSTKTLKAFTMKEFTEMVKNLP